MISTRRKEYDCIVSLGGCCNAANQLKHRGLRSVAMPFDWTLMRDDRPIRYLPEGIRTHFKDFCLNENMIEFEAPTKEHGCLRYRLEDVKTGFCFIHHFERPIENRKSFDRTRSVITRRINRFYEILGHAKSSLLILTTTFCYEPALLNEVLNALRETFPKNDIELAAIQFSAKTTTVHNTDDDSLHVMSCVRDVDMSYDNTLTSIEWSWLDSLSLTGKSTGKALRKKNTLIRLKYKIWKHLSKSLIRDGLPILAVSVPQQR